METILVLPLYLMLLGGMFVIGELLLGRYLAHDIERALAWRAADRFGPTSFDKKMYDYSTGDYATATNGISPEIRMVARTHRSGFWGNNWIATFGGRADVSVRTPWWTAFINVQGAMIGKGEDEAFEENFKLNSYENEFLDEPRVWVCRRRSRGDNGKPYDGGRENPAVTLNWNAIAFDHFPGTDASVGTAPEQIEIKDYKRCPLAILASGDY